MLKIDMSVAIVCDKCETNDVELQLDIALRDTDLNKKEEDKAEMAFRKLVELGSKKGWYMTVTLDDDKWNTICPNCRPEPRDRDMLAADPEGWYDQPNYGNRLPDD